MTILGIKGVEWERRWIGWLFLEEDSLSDFKEEADRLRLRLRLALVYVKSDKVSGIAEALWLLFANGTDT